MGGGKVKGYSHDWVQNSIAGYFAVFASFSFLWPENGGKWFFQKQVGQGLEDLARISSRTIWKAF